MYGKVLGAGIGASVAMLIGWPIEIVVLCGLVGVVLGHVFVDQEPVPKKAPRPVDELVEEGRQRRAAERPPELNDEQRALVHALAPLFVELARIDGDMTSEEVRQTKAFFEASLGFDEVGLEALRVALKDALASPPVDLETLAKQHRAAVTPPLRVEVLRAMYELVLADAPMSRAERDGLRRVVHQFNLSDEQLLQVTRDFFGSGAEHFKTLGLTEQASDDDIRSAFRRLAAEHHPDRVAAQGPQAIAAAEAKFRAVKDAYEALKQLRGL